MKTRVCIILLLVSSLILCSCSNDNDNGSSIPVNPFSNDIKLGMTYEEVMDKLSEIENITEVDNNIYCYGIDGYKIVGYMFNAKSLEYIVITAEMDKLSPEQLANKLLKGYKSVGTVSSVDTFVDEKNNMIAIVSTSAIDNVEYSSVAFYRYDGGSKHDEFEEYSGEQNGYKYVDLGLSIKWATCNIGATSPEDYGDYYAWGETSTKETYDWETYQWCNGTYKSMTKYCTNSYYGKVDNKTNLDLADDVAHVKWGGKWRMPTKEEIEELLDEANTTITWTTQKGINGIKVTSKKNGNSIFLPAAGYRWNGNLGSVGSNGYYWSSSLCSYYDCFAYYLYFYSGYWSWNYSSTRYDGRSVRAVCP